MKPVKRQWRLLFWRRSKRGNTEQKPDLPSGPRPPCGWPRSVRPSWATAMWAASPPAAGPGREGKGVAAKVLQSAGLEPESLKAAIARMVGVGAPGGAPSRGSPPVQKDHRALPHRGRPAGPPLRGYRAPAAGYPPRGGRGGGAGALRHRRGAPAAPRRRGGPPWGARPPPPPSGAAARHGSGSTAATQSCWTSSPAISPGWPPGACWTRWWAGTREINRVIQILSRRQKNNPALIGEPGVGKTAVAEGLARGWWPGMCPTSALQASAFPGPVLHGGGHQVPGRV